MSSFTVCSHVHCDEPHTEVVHHELLRLVNAAKVMNGCISHALYVDADDPNHFVCYSTWASQGDWLARMGSSATKAFERKTDGLMNAYIHEVERQQPPSCGQVSWSYTIGDPAQ